MAGWFIRQEHRVGRLFGMDVIIEEEKSLQVFILCWLVMRRERRRKLQKLFL